MLEARNLNKVFISGHVVQTRQKIINNLSLSIGPGESFGIFGPSGAGKSTLGKLLARLLEPTSGQLLFQGVDITHLKGKGLRQIRTRLQIVFQHPQSALHPKMKIVDLLKEPLKLHKLVKKSKIDAMVREMISRVDLHPEILNRYPAEISGGEIQRIVIARVIALKPCLIILDEPTAMLDPSVQAGILHLLMNLQQETGVSYLFISHDMRLIKRMCNRVGIMDRGRIVEQS